MKMPEKHDLLAAILVVAKEQGIGATLRLQWRTLRGRYMAVRLQNSNRRNDVRLPLSPSSFVTFDFAD